MMMIVTDVVVVMIEVTDGDGYDDDMIVTDGSDWGERVEAER